jgi:maltose O-acetyltransferase
MPFAVVYSVAAVNVNIGPKAQFGTGRNIFIGDNSGIGESASLRGRVIIGRNVMMASDVVM